MEVDDYGLSAVSVINHPVLVDEYSTDRAKVSLYCSGDMYFAITVIDDGRVELAFTQEGGTARSLWFTIEDLQGIETAACLHQSTEMNDSFVDAVIEYGKNNAEKSTPIQIYEEYVSEPQLRASTPNSDYEMLMSQLEDKYGYIHNDYDWTGNSSVLYQGNTYYFKENLDYYVSTSGTSFAFAAGVSLGALVIGILGNYLPTAIGVIAAVLGIPAVSDTIITHNGKLLRFGAGVRYYRYVMVNGKGPYDECTKSIEYWGWAEAGVYNTVHLQEMSTTYTPTELIFNSYTMQRDRACANYF